MDYDQTERPPSDGKKLLENVFGCDSILRMNEC